MYTERYGFVHCWSRVCTPRVTALFTAGHEFIHLGPRVCTLRVTGINTVNVKSKDKSIAKKDDFYIVGLCGSSKSLVGFCF